MSSGETNNASLAFLSGGGEMGALMRAHDWSTSSLGAPIPGRRRCAPSCGCCSTPATRCISGGARTSPASTTTPTASVGPERTRLDRPAGARGLGGDLAHHRPADRPGHGRRRATWHENQLVPITRNGRSEDVYWTYSYGPIDDETARASAACS